MDNRPLASVNVFRAENSQGRIDLAHTLGSTVMAIYIYDLPPGKSSCPYHYEYEEEWLLVVEGTISVRAPEGEQGLSQGDLVRFAAGPSGAHKLMNRGESPARVLMFSRSQAPAVSVYPDSDKIGVWPGDEDNALVFRRSSAVAWSDGEEDWDKAS